MDKLNYFITGGTGTLGTETARQILKQEDTGKIVIFSRDELKQKQMKSEFNDKRLLFVIGDIKDYESLRSSVHSDTDYIFHFAAMKHIDVCEENPMECIKTNFFGTVNVANVALEKNIHKVIFSTTDKAIHPINIYGMSKMMAERMIRQCSLNHPFNRFLIFRWGNVLGSRGSFAQIVKDSLEKQKKVKIAEDYQGIDVTRFFILIEDAVRFMLQNKDSLSKECLVPQMKAASINRVFESIVTHCSKTIFAYEKYPLPAIEKAHEDMIFMDKAFMNSMQAPQYSDDELNAMIKRCM